MAEKIKSINLLPNKEGRFLDQFLNWALTIGRLLIILTETLALSVFLYRFSLDMKIIDLHDKIKHQRAIVQQFKETETTARNLHARLAFADEKDKVSTLTPTTFSEVIDMGKGQVTFRNISVSGKTLSLDVQATNGNSLNLFVKRLKSYSGIEDVSIKSVENKTTSALIRMAITAQIKDI